jgi:hypothetical protein
MAVTLAGDVTGVMDALIAATEDVERRLEAAGESHAHDWMFALREVVYDLKRELILVAGLPDAEAVRERLAEISADVIYMLGPHAEHHLGEFVETDDDSR